MWVCRVRGQGLASLLRGPLTADSACTRCHRGSPDPPGECPNAVSATSLGAIERLIRLLQQVFNGKALVLVTYRDSHAYGDGDGGKSSHHGVPGNQPSNLIGPASPRG